MLYFQGHTKKAFSQEMRLLASLLIKAISSRRNNLSLLLFWLEEVDTSWAPAGGKRDA
jgi:hypothetical protein